MFPFRPPQKQGPRVDLLMSPDGFTESEVHQAEAQRSTQSSPAISAQSRASSQAAYYGEGQSEHDGMSGIGIESTYSFVSPSEAASSRTGESGAESSVGSGRRFRFPRIKLSLTAPPPKPKPKPKKQPPTPRSGVSFGRGGAGNAFRTLSNISPTTPTTAKSHKTSNSDPSVSDRLSIHTDLTGASLDYTLDYASDTGTYAPPRTHVGDRTSRWSFEPPSSQGVSKRSSLDSRRVDNGGFERHQYPAPLEVSTSTGLVGRRTTATTPPNIPPEAGRSRQEEQGQSLQDPLGSVMQSSRPSSAGALKEFGEFARTSRGLHVIRSSSPSDSDHHSSPIVPPPSYDEATDSLGQLHGPRNRFQYDVHVDAHHTTYAGPPHQGTYQSLRPLPTIPRRYDGRTTPMESAYLGHTRPVEGHVPWSHHHSMKKPAVAVSEAPEYTTERPNSRLSTTQHTKKPLYHQEPASSNSFHRLEPHLEGGEQPNPHVETETDTPPCESLARYHQRSVTPTVDSTRAHTPRSEPSMLDDTPTSSRAPAVTTSIPSSPLEVQLPLTPTLPLPATTMQAESDHIEGSQETQPKQLSKIERALLRRAVVGMKVDNSQV